MVMLRWWFAFFGSLFAAGGAGYLGYMGELWTIDKTKLSFLILAIYFGVTLFIGWLTHCAQEGYSDLADVHMNALDESADLCMRIAIVGTTLGFAIMVSSAFGHGLAATPAAIADLANGLSLIYLVTAVGVVCSTLISLQLVNLRYLVPGEA